jgi:MFS family permease
MEISFYAPSNIQATHFSFLATLEVLGKLLMQPIISMFTDYYGYSNAFILFCLFYGLCIISVINCPNFIANKHKKIIKN